MGTEPSKDAVEALAEMLNTHLNPPELGQPPEEMAWETLIAEGNPCVDAIRDKARRYLQAALPIERNRWEQEVRERLEKRALNVLREGREHHALTTADGTSTLRLDQTQGFSNRSESKLKTRAERAAERARFQAFCECLELLGIDESDVAANLRLSAIFGEAEPVEGESDD